LSRLPQSCAVDFDRFREDRLDSGHFAPGSAVNVPSPFASTSTRTAPPGP
jgi:hypothetical protein